MRPQNRHVPRPAVIALLAMAALSVLLAALAAVGLNASSAHAMTASSAAAHRAQSARVAGRSSTGNSAGAMPHGNLPGWREVFSDDFNGSSLNTNFWKPYTGAPGGDPNGSWSPSHVAVHNGQLFLQGYEQNGKYVTAGVSSQPGLVQTYGKYLVRFRMGVGRGVPFAMLLWPASNVPGPEIDFGEDNGYNRRSIYAFTHWGTAVADQFQARHNVITYHWHTLGVEWSPGQVVYTLDGKPWKTIRSSLVSNVPMVLDIQTESWCGPGQAPPNTWEQCRTASTPSEVSLDVAWVVAYARA